MTYCGYSKPMFYFCNAMQPRFIKTFFFLFTLGICHTPVFAQVKFTAEANPASIGKDETTELRFTVDNAKQVDEITPPALNDFTIVSGPNQETSMQNINGVITQSVGMSYLIQPKNTGTFIIAAATAKADGQTLYSNSVTIKVTAHSSGNAPQNNIAVSPFAGFPGMEDPMEQGSYGDNVLKKGENIQEKINKNMFLKAEADKASCYVGEPIVVTYKSYSRLPSESSVTKTPAFNGFSMIDITPSNNGNTNGRIEKLNGRSYDAFTLMKVQLYPLQAGQLSVGTIRTDNTIHFFKEEPVQSGGDAFFQNIMPAGEVVNQEVTLTNKPLFIVVKPLPDKDKPASFKGAVGNFTLTASLDKDSISTDDAGKLILTLTGAGNMTLINAPDIVWPAEIESFEPTLTDNLDKTKIPIAGSKQFEYNFTVQHQGKYIIPSIEFSFFDPKTATYKTVTTNPLPITVTKGTNRNMYPPTVATTTANNNSSFIDELNIPKLGLEISALLIVLVLFYWSNRKKNKQADTIGEEQTPQQSVLNNNMEEHKNYLCLSEEKLLQHDSKGFYEALHKEVRQFLSAYFHILPEEINKKRIAEELDKKGISIGAAIKIQQLMDHIEWQLYTPVHANAQLEESFANAKEMIYSLDSIAR
jgi:hypothetical protein